MKKVLSIFIFGLALQGCSPTENEAAPVNEKTEISLKIEAENIRKTKETVGYKLLTAESNTVISIDDGQVFTANQNLAEISRISNLSEKIIADMTYNGVMIMREHELNASSLDILDFLSIVFPLQIKLNNSKNTDYHNLMASTIAMYVGARNQNMSHSEAKESFVSMLNEMNSPDFSQRINDYMNSQP